MSRVFRGKCSQECILHLMTFTKKWKLFSIINFKYCNGNPTDKRNPTTRPSYLFFWQMKRCLPSAPRNTSSSIISMAVRKTGLRLMSTAISSSLLSSDLYTRSFIERRRSPTWKSRYMDNKIYHFITLNYTWSDWWPLPEYHIFSINSCMFYWSSEFRAY